jgi:sugar phosphate permease
VFYGWWIVGACFVISLYVHGIIGFGFTALIEPLSREFRWSYLQISLASSLRGVEVGLLAPIVGLLVDRWGPRRLMLGGTLLTGLALILMSRTASLGMFYGVFILIALGMTALSPTVTMTTMANWFTRRIGTATGIMHSGVGFSGLMIPIVVLLVDTLGWRTAMTLLGLFLLVIISLLTLIVRHRPEQYGLLPDGETGATVTAGKELVPLEISSKDIGAREAIRSSSFWHIALAMMFQIMLVNAVVTHMIPYVGSVGLPRATAGLIASAVPLTSVVGRLSFGWLSDRIDPRRIMGCGYIMMSLGLVFFTLAAGGNAGLLIPSVALFSIGFGGNAIVRATIIREYFGRRSFGTIHGFIMGVAVVGHLSGPPLAGWVFDTWGSYQGIWLAFAVLAVVPLLLIMTVSRPKRGGE